MVVAAVLLSGLVSGRAEAQQIEIRVVVPKETVEVVRQAIAAIERSITQTIDRRVWVDLSREITSAVREGFGGVSAVWQDRNFTHEQTDKQTHTLQLGASGSLQLKNIAGDVTVLAGRGQATTVEVTRRSRGRTDADAKLGLERVTVEIDHRGERATISTRYPDERRPPYAVTAAYVVTAPAGTSLTIATLSGDVQVKDIKGDVSIDVASGDITTTNSQVSSAKALSGDVSVADVQSSGRIDLSTLSGTITLLRVKARRLGTSTVSGDITARDIDANDVDMGTHSGDVEFSGGLAKTGRYELRSHSGSVSVIVPSDGFDLTARSFSGTITANPSLGLRTSETTRSSLRGTVGAGGAALAVTTFSGDIWILRKK